MAMIYDSFTITVLLLLEDLGFCKKGEGGAFVPGGPIALGGQLPINTDGGGLSSNHPGMRGIFLIIEAARQLRGQCGPRQVEGARLAVAHGSGGLLSSQATTILGLGGTSSDSFTSFSHLITQVQGSPALSGRNTHRILISIHTLLLD